MRICPECGVSESIRVDGRLMTEYELLTLLRAPTKIERTMIHNIRCTQRESNV